MADKVTFEDLLKELDIITKTLEEKELPLDQALSMYQKGLELSKQCYDMLEEAQKLIVKEMK
jgi:exodeoxyribonuclease VII small subunit